MTRMPRIGADPEKAISDLRFLISQKGRGWGVGNRNGQTKDPGRSNRKGAKVAKDAKKEQTRD